MYKTDFYITQAAPKNSGKKYTFAKVSGWGELLEAPNGELIEIRLDKRPEGWRVSEEKNGVVNISASVQNSNGCTKSITPRITPKNCGRTSKAFRPSFSQFND